MTNENKIPLSSEEITYFEGNEVGCLKAIKEKKIVLEDGKWYKYTNDILIPKEHLDEIQETYLTFDYDNFMKKHMKDMTEEEISVILSHNILSSNNSFSKTFKKRAYSTVLQVKKRLEK